MRLWACRQRASVVQAQRHVHNRAADFRSEMPIAPHRHRRPVAQRLVWACLVIKADPRTDPGTRLATIGIALQIDVLMLERTPQPLNEDVVHPPAAAIHVEAHSGSRQYAGEGGAGELADLVGIEELRPPETRQG